MVKDLLMCQTTNFEQFEVAFIDITYYLHQQRNIFSSKQEKINQTKNNRNENVCSLNMIYHILQCNNKIILDLFFDTDELLNK